MIFYFSGTGNSFYAAQKIAETSGDSVYCIPDEMKRKDKKLEYFLEAGESVGFVYPVYAWAPPFMVIEFIRRLSLPNYKDHFIYSVATCSQNIGNTMGVLKKEMRKKGMTLHSGFSLIMPNNYIILNDVDTENIEKKKLVEADERIGYIINSIQKQSRGVFDVTKGTFPALLTTVINPVFNKFGMKPDKFYATAACTACGLCEKVCPVDNIKVINRPVFGSICTQCMACIQRCPEAAIQYGKTTVNKGRYIHPILRE